MEIIGLEVSALSLLVALVLMVRRSGGAARRNNDASVSRVRPSLQISDLTQRSYVDSLENLCKNIDSLAARIAAAELQLDRLFGNRSSDPGRDADSAPRLLEYGSQSGEVGAQIDLPLGVAQQAQALNETMELAHKVDAANTVPGAMESADAPVKNSEPRQITPRPQPILLIDIVATGNPIASADDDAMGMIKDAAA